MEFQGRSAMSGENSSTILSLTARGILMNTASKSLSLASTNSWHLHILHT